MKLINTAYKIRCDLGVCKNLASKTIVMDRVSAKNHIHVCEFCLQSLYQLIGEQIIPKPIQTLKNSKKRGEKNVEK